MESQFKHTYRPQKRGIEGSNQTAPTSYFDVANVVARENNGIAYQLSARGSGTSLESIRATPPVDIPHAAESAIEDDINGPSRSQDGSFMDQYLRNHEPSVSFSDEVQTDMGYQVRIGQALPQSPKDPTRGRSILQELAEARARQELRRSYSESVRDHYDHDTGRHRPEYSSSPPREEFHIGERRFPLLQKTVDEMARESHLKINTQPMSMTSQSTMSPVSEVLQTPQDGEPQHLLSPSPISAYPRHISTSLEGSAPRPFRRSASQRWLEGEASQDFFTRASSLRNSNKIGSSYKSPSRRDTGSSTNTNSAAFAFLQSLSSAHSGDGELSRPSEVDAQGQTIGDDYVLGKKIGSGGFSTIREVTQLSAETGDQRKLAVKIVRRNIDGKTESENDTAQMEFDHEVEVWRFLNHPHILPLEAVYKLDEATFCFIPLNTGGTLFDIMRESRQGLAHELAKTYAYQLASALRYLHLDARVVHRDVKLENCLVERSDDNPGTLRLCDFGMAEWLDSDQEVASPGSTSSSSERTPQKLIGPADTSSVAFAGGSLEYAPPEIVRIASSSSLPSQLSGSIAGTLSSLSPQRSRVSAAADIWSFGVCLYTLITGKRPFFNNFEPRTVMAILAGNWDHELLREKADDDEDLIDLVRGCLIMDEKRRWDIRAVVECQWFEEERERAESTQDSRSGGWHL